MNRYFLVHWNKNLKMIYDEINRGRRSTCQKGAGPVEQTASVLGRCTCCNFSQSLVQEAPQNDPQHEAASHSQRFSSPAKFKKNVVFIYYFFCLCINNSTVQHVYYH